MTHLANNIAGGADQPRVPGLPERYVLFVGTRNTYKNFPLFVDAAAPVVREDSTLGIACIGGGAFTAEERALLDRAGIADRVVQKRVADHELAACYAHALVFVFPSQYEGFGIPILEAFACGCPAIIADASCFPEIAGDAARYFDPGSTESLTVALREVLGDATVRDALRAKGLSRARDFSWEATARTTLDVYRAITGESRSTAVAS